MEVFFILWGYFILKISGLVVEGKGFFFGAFLGKVSCWNRSFSNRVEV